MTSSNKGWIEVAAKILSPVKVLIFRLYYQFSVRKYKQIHLLSFKETISAIVNGKVSVARFGDGEIKWMLNIPQDSFQEGDKQLSARLAEVLSEGQLEGFLVCLPEIFKSHKGMNKQTKLFWLKFFFWHGTAILPYMKPDGIYGDAQITRCYIGHKDKSGAAERFTALKTIWENRDVLIVEGEHTRLGVGNDLLGNARSVSRILCPSSNAFGRYEEILAAASRLSKDRLILIALGPTATVLALDLHKTGYQAIDIGHIDIEYEWYLRGAQSKISIPGKFVNESDNHMLNVRNYDKDYLDQIIARIGC
ncbi:MAG TPA: SP_1767 family glycosyltransferase [Candidatus Saccharimonadales bacterium]|nr:SP_1767 family glycosyltransferase [Candidatus Saccharimonadales bacterium]